MSLHHVHLSHSTDAFEDLAFQRHLPIPHASENVINFQEDGVNTLSFPAQQTHWILKRVWDWLFTSLV